MVNEITQDEVQQYLADCGASVQQKGNWIVWWHRVVQLFFFIVGIFNPKMKKSFYEDYVTTIGYVIYMPDLESYKDNPSNYQAVILHELDHAMEYKRRGLDFFLKYILSAKWRAYFEYKAYCHQFIHFYNQYNRVSPQIIANVARHFQKGSIYLLDEPGCVEILTSLARAVEDGRIYGKTAEGFEKVWVEVCEEMNDSRGGFANG